MEGGGRGVALSFLVVSSWVLVVGRLIYPRTPFQALLEFIRLPRFSRKLWD